MAGLYIHIPFCRSKCDYCDFFSMPLATACRQGGKDVYQRYVSALLSELKLRKDEINQPIQTVYIGGGTPSALPGDWLPKLVEAILQQIGEWDIVEEVTVEANPEDISLANLRRWRNAGVNRISIGVQSFEYEQLSKAGRQHSVEAALQALEILAVEGINYNADLIYGLPGQSLESWLSQLRKLLTYSPNHLSAYLLSYEPGTRLFVRRERGAVEEADESLVVAMYDALCHEMVLNGYHHYEISNFSKPEFASRHNSAYWDLTPYLGLGCSAHSFDGVSRRYNPSSLGKYLAKIERGVVAAEVDDESLTDRINDYIITSLRTCRGLSLDLVVEKWGRAAAEAILQKSLPFLKVGQMLFNYQSVLSFIDVDPKWVVDSSQCGFLSIQESAWLTADCIFRELLLD